MAMDAAKIRSDMLKQTEKNNASAKKKLAKIKAKIRAGKRLTKKSTGKKASGRTGEGTNPPKTIRREAACRRY